MFSYVYTGFIVDERVLTLSWYQSINLKDICDNSTRTTFIHSVEFLQ
jgi:hypothetical protein